MSSSHANASVRRRRSLSASLGRIATTAVVAYGTYRLVDWARNAWFPDQEWYDDNYLNERSHDRGITSGNSRQRRHGQWKLRCQRVKRCRLESVQALKDLLPTLRRTLDELTDTREETRALKQIRAEKRQNDGESLDKQNLMERERRLWDTIKVKTLTRMIAAAYAHTLVFLALTVQVHIIGGRLFEEQSRSPEGNSSNSWATNDETTASDRMGSYQSSHRLVLTRTYEYFFDQGISSLVRTVERAVSDVVYDWDVMGPSFVSFSQETLEDAIAQIREIVERDKRPWRSRVRGNQLRQTHPRSITRFLLPPEHILDESSVTDTLAQSILDETWDIVESPLLDDALKDCLDDTFQTMKVEHWSNIFADSSRTVPPPGMRAEVLASH